MHYFPMTPPPFSRMSGHPLALIKASLSLSLSLIKWKN